jgi:hypothetical protein
MDHKFYDIEKVCKSIDELAKWNKYVDERKKPKKRKGKKK